MAQLARWGLLGGLVVASVGGFVVMPLWFPGLLVVLGLLVGALGIAAGERSRFLLASLALLVAANAAGSLPWIGGAPSIAVANLIAFLGPAVVVVAVKTLFGVTVE